MPKNNKKPLTSNSFVKLVPESSVRAEKKKKPNKLQCKGIRCFVLPDMPWVGGLDAIGVVSRHGLANGSRARHRISRPSEGHAGVSASAVAAISAHAVEGKRHVP